MSAHGNAVFINPELQPENVSKKISLKYVMLRTVTKNSTIIKPRNIPDIIDIGK